MRAAAARARTHTSKGAEVRLLREGIEAAAKDVATAKEYERLAEYLFGTGCAPLLRPACPAPLLTASLLSSGFQRASA